jgi:hypothetical protein
MRMRGKNEERVTLSPRLDLCSSCEAARDDRLLQRND